MSMQTCCHLSDFAPAWQLHSNYLQVPWNRESPVSCMSLKHIIATAQVSSSSPPLLNASLSSAFSLHLCVPASPPDPGCGPAVSLGLPSREAPTLRTPTGGSPGCTSGCREASPFPPYPCQGHQHRFSGRLRLYPAFLQPHFWRGGIPTLPGPRCPRARRRPERLPALTAAFRLNVP